MTAPEKIRELLFARAKGHCECTMKCNTHTRGRCQTILRGAWEVHRVTAGGEYSLSNCKAMCQPCHKNTPSYGRG